MPTNSRNEIAYKFAQPTISVPSHAQAKRRQLIYEYGQAPTYLQTHHLTPKRSG